MPVGAIRIAAVTLNPKYGDIKANKNTIIEWLELAASQAAKLVVFPEGFLSGYDLDIKERSALRIDDDAIEEIAHHAEALGTIASFGFIERTGDGYYVSQAFVGKDVRAIYRKCHLTGWEKEHCLAGHELSIQDLGAFKTGTLICYDSAFPRASEYLVRSGAELLITPTCNGMWLKDVEAKGGKESVIQARKEHVYMYWRARSYDYSVYSLYVESVGETSKGEFHPGYAVIFGPDGNCLAEITSGKEGMICAEIHPGNLQNIREDGVGHFKTLSDARPELYNNSEFK